MLKKKESHKRSFAKTISWRCVATTTTMAIVYIFTGKMKLSIGVGAVEVVSKVILYYIHERAWINISWGKNDAS